MEERQLPRIGCVKFINARPLIHGWPGEVLLDGPSALCRKLSAGELGIALVSSLEFLRNPIYRIVDGISISSDGPVYSVIVAHRLELTQIETLKLDPASETSVALLRHFLAQRGLNPRLFPSDEPAIPEDPRTAHLLIGDRALRFRQEYSDFHYWDLGREWKATAGLPFVYALWLVRPEIIGAEEIAQRLRALRDHNLSALEGVIAGMKEFDAAFCRDYYRHNLRFSFGDAEKKGLRAFANACAQQNLIPRHQLQFDLV